MNTNNGMKFDIWIISIVGFLSKFNLAYEFGEFTDLDDQLSNVGRERVGNDVLNMGRFNLTLALAGVWQSLTIYISAHSSATDRRCIAMLRTDHRQYFGFCISFWPKNAGK